MSHDSPHDRRHPSFPDRFGNDVPPVDDLSDIDPRFIVDFQSYDDLADGQRWSTWLSVEPLSRGPEPRPDWVVTSQGAVDTELGILKTGKEADVHLLERADPHNQDDGVVMAAKRYRSPEHRSFHRAASYTEGRSMKRSRDERALKRKSTFGRLVAASEWAVSEWAALVRFWNLGLPVPYPVQIDETEILMEWISVVDENGDLQTAPRLAQTRPAPELLYSYFDQVTEVLATMVQNGVVHGDLSAYNILAQGDRLVVIDLPQIVDLIGNLNGMDYLQRDCANICAWFRARGLETADEHALFGELMAHAFLRGRPVRRPTLFLTVGLPGTGKTTAARRLEIERQALRLTKDEWVKALYGHENPPAAQDVIEGLLIQVGLRALELGTDVVIDYGLWGRDERSALRQAAADLGAHVELHYFEITTAEQRERLAQRLTEAPDTSWPMSDEELARWAAIIDVPTPGELDGSEPIDDPPAGFATWNQWRSDRWPPSV